MSFTRELSGPYGFVTVSVCLHGTLERERNELPLDCGSFFFSFELSRLSRFFEIHHFSSCSLSSLFRLCFIVFLSVQYGSRTGILKTPIILPDLCQYYKIDVCISYNGRPHPKNWIEFQVNLQRIHSIQRVDFQWKPLIIFLVCPYWVFREYWPLRFQNNIVHQLKFNKISVAACFNWI